MEMKQEIGACMNDVQCAMSHHRGAVWTVAAVMAGATLLGGIAYLAWNSRQAKMLRAVKRTGSILRKSAAILQSIAEVPG